MNIKVVRILNFIFALVIIWFRGYHLLYYVVASHFSMEFLNSRKKYFQHRYMLFNLIFFSYELVLIERLRTFKFSAIAEWLLNNAEHIFFGMVICLMIYIYLIVLLKKQQNLNRIRIAAVWILFNLIGVINEFFQNAISHRQIFILIPDSIKDIGMNLIGSSIFLIIACWQVFKRRKRMNIIDVKEDIARL